MEPYPLADISLQLRQPQPPQAGGELPRGNGGLISPAAAPVDFAGRFLLLRGYILLITLVELPPEQRRLGPAAPLRIRSSGLPPQPDPGPGSAARRLPLKIGLLGKIWRRRRVSRGLDLLADTFIYRYLHRRRCTRSAITRLLKINLVSPPRSSKCRVTQISECFLAVF